MPPEPSIQLAIQHHQAGRLREAEGIYREILRGQPNHADALHLLGLLAGQAGNSDAAMELIGRAIAIKPDAVEYQSNLIVTLLGRGEFELAAQACERAIKIKPGLVKLHISLGNALSGLSKLEDAAAAYRRALQLEPGNADALGNLGNALTRAGRDDEALDAYHHAIRIQPNRAEFHSNLGNALIVKRETEQAILAYRRAIELKPNYAEAYSNLGSALRSEGKLGEAIAAGRMAVQLRPEHVDGLINLAHALRDAGELNDAIAIYRRIVQLQPGEADSHLMLANALRDAMRFDEAIEQCRRAVDLKPEDADAHNGLGNALRARGELEQAITSFERALQLNPHHPEVYCNLGNVLKNRGEVERSIGWYRRAVQLLPDSVEAHSNLAHALLQQGDFEQGWIVNEWRLAGKSSGAKRFAQPQWKGEPLEGRTILIHAEQGMGDTIQFVRYAAMLSNRGGRVLLECQPELARLLAKVPDITQVVVRGGPLPAFDFHCPMLSLPMGFKTGQRSIPGQVPYLFAEKKLIEKWQGRLASCANQLKVGLVWAGNPLHKNDRNRSLALSQLSPLAAVEGIQYVSLQKGPPVGQINAATSQMNLIELGSLLPDFADTAAVIAGLDLLITVDTSVAHLAGAMGKAVWVLLPFDPDWRWLLHREDSPWYPSMRLFRQKAPGNWTEVIERVAIALQNLNSQGPVT